MQLSAKTQRFLGFLVCAITGPSVIGGYFFLMRRAQLRGRAGCYRSTVQAPFTAFLCGHEKGVPRGPSSWDLAPVSSSN